MKTEKLNIIETLFTIKFDKELQAILIKDLDAIKYLTKLNSQLIFK